MKDPSKKLIPPLPARAWRVLAADAVSALGTGLVMPFLMVYLRDVRNISITTAGFAVATLAFVALLAGPPAGALVDRFGSRKALIGSLILCALGSFALALIRETWHAFIMATLLGLGFAALWPATHSLLTSIVDREHRSSVYAVHYMTLNAGIGIGGIIGGLYLKVGDARTFEIFYMLDALSWLVFAFVLWRMKDIGAPFRSETGEKAEGGYRDVVKDRTLLMLLGIAAVLVTVGYSQLESGYPAYVTGEGGASTRLLGAAFAANTFVIVGAQLVVLRWLEGKRRTRALIAICLLWAMAWSVTLGAGQIEAQLIKNLGFMLAMVFFALGECLVSPTIPGMVNDLATDELRGRYNAGYSLTFSTGHIIGPAIAGIMLGRDLAEPFFAGLVGVCLLTILFVRYLERRVPEDANRISADDPDPDPQKVEGTVLTA